MLDGLTLTCILWTIDLRRRKNSSTGTNGHNHYISGQRIGPQNRPHVDPTLDPTSDPTSRFFPRRPFRSLFSGIFTENNDRKGRREKKNDVEGCSQTVKPEPHKWNFFQRGILGTSKKLQRGFFVQRGFFSRLESVESTSDSKCPYSYHYPCWIKSSS
jgi:hypothetical protein